MGLPNGGGTGGAIYDGVGYATVCGIFCLSVPHSPSLSLNTVYFFNNNATFGGAIYTSGPSVGTNFSTTNISNSYFATNYGAAIENGGGSSLTIAQSTFTGNSGYPYFFACDIFNGWAGTVQVSNTTFYGGPSSKAPAIWNDGVKGVVEYSTFVGFYPTTEADHGLPSTQLFSGVVAGTSSTTLIASILASYGGYNCPLPSGPSALPIDGGYNIDSGFSCPFSYANFSANGLDPQINLATFGANGGATPTFILPVTSPAVDMIPPGRVDCGKAGTPGVIDQRGVTRPQGPDCDIGSIERVP